MSRSSLHTRVTEASESSRNLTSQVIHEGSCRSKVKLSFALRTPPDLSFLATLRTKPTMRFTRCSRRWPAFSLTRSSTLAATRPLPRVSALSTLRSRWNARFSLPFNMSLARRPKAGRRSTLTRARRRRVQLSTRGPATLLPTWSLRDTGLWSQPRATSTSQSRLQAGRRAGPSAGMTSPPTSPPPPSSLFWGVRCPCGLTPTATSGSAARPPARLLSPPHSSTLPATWSLPAQLEE
mmetsp:Transcript_6901/g.15875  ORF Transcript_6901/g.15875 Transcript_6901/m.15875 type:complete len:237 (+) Transcript_6901:712-1422(+)